jgi:hypothetical protein
MNMTKANPVVPDALLTAQAVNIRFAEIKEKFRRIGVPRPIPFIVWGGKLNAKQEDRLQQAFAARATKADMVLLPTVEQTLEQMSQKRLNAA